MSPPPSGHGDIATMRFEEYIVEFSFAFLFISVTGYGDILPERFEESPSLMATFSLLDITGDGDIGPVRFVEYIFIPISASSPSSSWCAPWSTSLATTTSSLCAARSTFSTYPSLRRPPHYLCATRSTSSLHFYAAFIQGVHCRYPLPRPLSTSAPPASTGAPCTISFLSRYL